MPSLPADVVVDDEVLARHPLPPSSSDTDKHERGTVVVVGSSRETIGATLLAGTAALRCGAGKLQMLVDHQMATSAAVAVPEARVVGVPHAADAVDGSTFDACAPLLQKADAVLVGPGTLDGEHGNALALAVARHLGPQTALVLDAGALAVFSDGPGIGAHLLERTAAIPNVSEASRLLDVEPSDIVEKPHEALDELVSRLSVGVVALRDALTWIGTRDGRRFVDRAGHPALATSGSGDVLAGMLAGFAARGAAPITATLWAVHAHGRVGERLASHDGGIGLLARELLDSIAVVVNGLPGRG